MKRLSLIVAALLLILASCSRTDSSPVPIPTRLSITPTFFATDTPAPPPIPLYVNLVWNFHQPFYAVDAQTGLMERPWIRAMGTRVYFPMAELLARYPKVHATVSFSPVLLQQLQSFLSGTRDIYWELSVRPAKDLSDEDRQFIIEHFFDAATQSAINQLPRYRELYTKRGGSGEAQMQAAMQSFNEQDVRDLQVLYNLAWYAGDALNDPPLRALVAKGRDYSDDDKSVLFDAILTSLHSINSLFSQLQAHGQIEVATTPYAHPILPLLLDNQSATGGRSQDQLPDPPFQSAVDTTEQLKRAREIYQQSFAHAPGGLVPVAGAVSQALVAPVANEGFQWMVSGESVLAQSLKVGEFHRNTAGIVQDTDTLYHPYRIRGDGKQESIFFADTELSRLVKTAVVSTTDVSASVQNMMQRLQAVRNQTSKDRAPRIVTMVIDDAEAQAGSADGGMSYLNALFQKLSDSADQNEIVTITPAKYLADHPQVRTLDHLSTGTWGSHGATDMSPWIGSQASNAAWVNLGRARSFLDPYLTGSKSAEPDALASAYNALLLAEGSDWYLRRNGQNDADSSYLDRTFRNLLAQVYTAVGAPAPEYLLVPILPTVVLTGDRSVGEIITPTIDGVVTANEWDRAAVLKGSAQAQGQDNPVIDAFYYGANATDLFFRLDALEEWAAIASGVDSPQSLRIGIYLQKPGAGQYSEFTRVGGDAEVRTSLRMSATHLLEWTLEPDGTSSTALYSVNSTGGWAGTATVYAPGAAVGKTLETALPIRALGGLEPGAKINIVVIVSRDGDRIASFPTNGLAQMVLPDMGVTSLPASRVIATFDDPVGDDHGPGSYTYPTSAVFNAGAFDLKRFTIATDQQSLVFSLELNSSIENVWNSPIGLSLQTFDIYIDKDPGRGTGERKLLPGRNASLAKGNGWEYALWIEGWNQQLFAFTGAGDASARTDVPITVEVDPAGSLTISLPRSALGDGDPAKWGYAVAVLSQEAFPSAGVWRVRDVDPVASEWRIGGAPADTNHTRIMDLLVPADAAQSQEAALSQYEPLQETDMQALGPDSFGIAPLVTISTK